MPAFLHELANYKDQIAILLAALALVYTAFQFSSQKRHNTLMVRPHLDSQTEKNDYERTFTLELTNNGIGPAVITHVEFFYKGELISSDSPIEVLLERLQKDLPNYISHDGWHIAAVGAYISPGELLKLLDLEFYVEASRTSATDFLKYLIEHVELKIWYQSIYGEEFLFTAKDPLSSLKPLCRIKWFRKSNAKHHSV